MIDHSARGARFALCVLCAALWACTTVGAATLPAEPHGADALATTCSTIDYARPYVVDWSGVDRADLREVQERGVIAVQHDCDVLRVLTDCTISGHYGFVGMSAEESLVELQTAADVRANLPISGVQLSGELGQDSALVLALAHAGKRVALLDEHPTLRGACSGATHYIRGIYEGAFAMETSTRGHLRSAAELLGAGASADASAQRRFRVNAGTSAQCAAARPEAAAPPTGCDVPLRLELRLIESLQARSPAPAAEATDFVGCPEGFVEVDARCLARDESVAYACSPSDLEECKAQCEDGNAVSCAREAYLLHHGESAPADLATAAALYDRACRSGVQHGCSGLAVFIKRGLGGLAANPARAFELQNAACRAGEMRGCSSLGVFFDDGEVVAENAAEAFRLYDRACQSGLAVACSNLGTLYRDGRGTAQSDADAARFFQRACVQDSANGCDNLRDLVLAKRASGGFIATLIDTYERDCSQNVAPACASLERIRALGRTPP